MTRKHKPKTSKLSDNPTFQLLPALFQHAESIHSFSEFLLEQGVEHDVLDHLIRGARYTLDNGDYVEVAERFNDTFAKQGWIATESFCIDTMREALFHRDEERFEEAEEAILDWFNETRRRMFGIGRCGYFGDHESRKDQLDEALELTREERYQSAIPLILIACEGFARDVLTVKLFSKEPDLTAFDTFVWHQSALPTLVHELTRGVAETSEEMADLPGRHGIMHGRTLGYATKSNCMKAWLLFIALTELHIERRDRVEASKEAFIPAELNVKDVALILLEREERQARLES